MKISVCSSEKRAQLRYLYDKISVNVRDLEALGIKSQQYGSLLIPIIMAKLPPEIRIHVARNTSQDIWEIEALPDLLQHEIEAREISEKIKAVTPNETTPPRRQPDFSWKPRNVRPPPTTGTFFVDNQSPPLTPICGYCSERHFSASCENVTEISARKSILARDKRCFKCLRKGHHQDQCDKHCKRCARGHHQSICPRNTYTNTHAYNTQNSTLPFNYDRPPQEGIRNQSSKEDETTVHGATTATTDPLVRA